MRILKTVALIAAVVMVFGMVACSSSNGSAVDKLGASLDDVIKIMKSNVKDPKAAAVALTKYTAANGAKLAALQVSLKKEMATKTQAEMMKSFLPLLGKMKELEKLSVMLAKDADFAKAMAAYKGVAGK